MTLTIENGKGFSPRQVDAPYGLRPNNYDGRCVFASPVSLTCTFGASSVLNMGRGYEEVNADPANGAYQFFRAVETGQRKSVGVNCFTGENELEANPSRP